MSDTTLPAEQLPPCPICSGIARMIDGYPLAMVKCQDCGCRVLKPTLKEAIEAWSRRTAPADEIAGALAELREILKPYRLNYLAITQGIGGGSKFAQISIDTDEHQAQYFNGSDVADCMAAVRQWKKEQGKL